MSLNRPILANRIIKTDRTDQRDQKGNQKGRIIDDQRADQIDMVMSDASSVGVWIISKPGVRETSSLRRDREQIGGGLVRLILEESSLGSVLRLQSLSLEKVSRHATTPDHSVR